MSFTYVNIIGKGCEGWINLFFGEYCIAMINDVELANAIKLEIKEKGGDKDTQHTRKPTATKLNDSL